MTDNPRTGPTALAERNAAIARERAAGDSWSVIAAKHGLSVRQAARGYEDAIGGSADRIRSRPEEVADVVLEAHLEAVSRLRGLATARNTSVAVAAAGRLPGAASALLDTAEKLGLAPGADCERVHVVDVREVLKDGERRATVVQLPGDAPAALKYAGLNSKCSPSSSHV